MSKKQEEAEPVQEKADLIEMPLTKKVYEREQTITITKESAPWAPEEYLGDYKARRWTWRERQNAMVDASVILDEKTGLTRMNVLDYHVNMMLVCIVERPKSFPLPWTAETINNMDPDIIEPLKEACREINGLTKEEKRSFPDSTPSREQTPVADSILGMQEPSKLPRSQ